LFNLGIYRKVSYFSFSVEAYTTSPPSHIFQQEYILLFYEKQLPFRTPDLTHIQPTHWICPPTIHLYRSRRRNSFELWKSCAGSLVPRWDLLSGSRVLTVVQWGTHRGLQDTTHSLE